jgi:hypothetical protein
MESLPFVRSFPLLFEEIVIWYATSLTNNPSFFHDLDVRDS